MFPISDSEPSRTFPFINYALIIATCYVWFLQVTAPNFELFVYQYALIPDAVNFTSYESLYPFITSMFLHAGWLHIISNMWFLRVFGDNVEGEIGHIPYLLLYIFSGIAGGLAQYALSPGSEIPMLGASGAVAGALGAYFTLFPRHKVKSFIPVFGFFTIADISASLMLGYWFVLQIISGWISLPTSGGAEGGVAFWAHIGGFVAGLVMGRLFTKREKRILEGEVI